MNIESVHRVIVRHVEREKWESPYPEAWDSRDWSNKPLVDRVIQAAQYWGPYDKKKAARVELIFLADAQGIWGVARSLGVMEIPVSLQDARGRLANCRTFIVDINGVPPEAVAMVGTSKPFTWRQRFSYGVLVDGRLVMDADERRRPKPTNPDDLLTDDQMDRLLNTQN